MIWFLLACTPSSDPLPADSGTHPDLPEHSECLPEGEEMSDEVCAAVVEADGRLPTIPQRAQYTYEDLDDERLDDPEYQWLESEVKRCACVCCHSASIGGPGSHRWDIEFEPVWIDSMNDWSMSVFIGDTEEPLQTLPTTDLPRLRAVIGAERDRRALQRP